MVFRPVLNPLLGLTTVQVLLMLVLIWTAGVFQLWAQEQRAVFQYRGLVAVTLIYCIMAPALGILFMAKCSDKVTARIIGMAVASVGTYGWMFFSQYRKGKTFCSPTIWKYALTLALPLIPHYLSQMILNSSDRIMISYILGDSEAGIYSLAYSVSLIMTIFNTSLLSTIEPWVYQKLKEKEINKIKNIAYPSFVLIALINLMLIVFSPDVIKLFAPASY